MSRSVLDTDSFVSFSITVFGTVNFSSATCPSAYYKFPLYASIRIQDCGTRDTRCAMPEPELQWGDTFLFQVNLHSHLTCSISYNVPACTKSTVPLECIGSVQVPIFELLSCCSDSQHACLPLQMSQIGAEPVFVILHVAEATDCPSLVEPDNFVHVLTERSSFLISRAQCLLFRFSQTGSLEDLDLAVADYNLSLNLLPLDHPLRPAVLNGLANGHLKLFEQYSDEGNLELCLSTALQALQSSTNHLQSLISLNVLTRGSCAIYAQSGNAESLESALKYGSQALELCAPGDLFRSTTLDNLAGALKRKFQLRGEMSDLETTILYLTESLQLRPSGHPDRCISLSRLAYVLYARFQRNGDREDLESSICYATESLLVGPRRHAERADALDNLGVALWVRFRRWGVAADLDLAIQHHGEALSLRRPKHFLRYRSLKGMACALSSRFSHQGDIADLDLAIGKFNDALALLPPHHMDHCSTLNDLAIALNSRFIFNGQLSELEHVISCFSEILRLKPSSSLLPNVYTNLGTVLCTRFKLVGDLADLNESIVHLRRGLALRPPGHNYRSVSLLNLAQVVMFRFHRDGNLADLTESLNHEMEALTLRPEGHPGRALLLHNLGYGLLYRFERFGNMADLDQATRCIAEALELRPPGNPDRAMSFLSLALAMRMCFEHYGDLPDLERATDNAFEALSLRPPGHPLRLTTLSVIADIMWIQYEARGDMDSLDLSIQFLEEALEQMADGHQSRSTAARSLALALQSRFVQTSNMENLDLAMTQLSKAYQHCSAVHGSRELLNTTADILIAKYEASGNSAILELAFSHLSLAEKELPADHPYLHSIYKSLALAHNARYLFSREQCDQEECFRLIEKAVQHGTAGLQTRLTSSLWWISTASAQKHDSLLSAYRACLNILDRYMVLVPAIVRRHRIRRAAVPMSLPSDAAACAIERGELEVAVELLEQGRSLLWAQLGRFRTPLDDLQASGEKGQKLAEQFERLSYLLETGGIYRVDENESPRRSADDKLLYKEIWIQWESVVEEIRGIQGFSRFLKVLPFSKLQEAASCGPVVIVNVSESRCDAIIIIKDQSPRLVPLPATINEVCQLSSDFRSALSAATARGEEKHRSQQMILVLRKLWALVVLPIALELQTVVHLGSRIWWCPTSRLVSLPLHAAGTYRSGQPSMLSMFTSSYTPALSTLIKARQAPRTGTQARRLLAIGQAKSYAGAIHQELPCVERELNLLGHMIPPTMSFSRIDGAHGTYDAALRGLSSNHWIHIACHGIQNDANPYDSYLSLGDKPLKLLDIIQAHPAYAEFAFLSACHTAVGDDDSPDESIHLAAGLQFSGFRSVVGTIGPVDDNTVGCIVEGFYRRIFADDFHYTDAAQALNRAVRASSKSGVPLDQRVIFIHLGA